VALAGWCNAARAVHERDVGKSVLVDCYHPVPILLIYLRISTNLHSGSYQSHQEHPFLQNDDQPPSHRFRNRIACDVPMAGAALL
jgi:hypothetical protein